MKKLIGLMLVGAMLIVVASTAFAGQVVQGYLTGGGQTVLIPSDELGMKLPDAWDENKTPVWVIITDKQAPNNGYINLMLTADPNQPFPVGVGIYPSSGDMGSTKDWVITNSLKYFVPVGKGQLKGKGMKVGVLSGGVFDNAGGPFDADEVSLLAADATHLDFGITAAPGKLEEAKAMHGSYWVTALDLSVGGTVKITGADFNGF